MYRVTLEYSITTPQNGTIFHRDVWRENHSDEAHAVDMAKSDSEVLLITHYGRGARITWHHIESTLLERCVPCDGTGKLASMEGYYTCNTCEGRRYHEAGNAGE